MKKLKIKKEKTSIRKMEWKIPRMVRLGRSARGVVT